MSTSNETATTARIRAASKPQKDIELMWFMRLKRLTATVAFMLLVGCSPSVIVEKVLPKEEDAVARSYIDKLRQHDFEDIEKHLHPDIVNENTRASLAKMAAAFPDSEPLSTKPVGVFITSGPTAKGVGLSYEYEFPDKWLLINVALHETKDGSTIEGFHVEPLADSYEHLHQFTLSGKNVYQYAVLGFAIFAPALCLYALVTCIRARLKGRKWLWILFIVAGLGRLSINWTTGQWSITPLAFQLFSASAIAAPYGPWIVSVSLPLGAVAFLLLKRRLTRDVGQTSGNLPA